MPDEIKAFVLQLGKDVLTKAAPLFTMALTMALMAALVIFAAVTAAVTALAMTVRVVLAAALPPSAADLRPALPSARLAWLRPSVVWRGQCCIGPGV